MSSNPAISEEDLKSALVEMAAALAQFHANYAVIGGMATAYRSQHWPFAPKISSISKIW